MFIQRKDSSGNWNLCFRRSHFGWERKEVVRLYGLLCAAPSLRAGFANHIRWAASSSGQFMVHSVFMWCESALGLNIFCPGMLLHNVTPHKAQFFCLISMQRKN
ncbi:unnamed protein product [Camellia sinensis]